MRLRRLGAGLALVLAVPACNGDGDGGPGTSTTSTSAATSTSTTLPPAASAEAASRGLYEAWRAGDRAKAATFATPQAVDRLFQDRASVMEPHGCEERLGGASATCAFRYEGGGLSFTVERQGDRWVVTQVAFTAD